MVKALIPEQLNYLNYVFLESSKSLRIYQIYYGQNDKKMSFGWKQLNFFIIYVMGYYLNWVYTNHEIKMKILTNILQKNVRPWGTENFLSTSRQKNPKQFIHYNITFFVLSFIKSFNPQNIHIKKPVSKFSIKTALFSKSEIYFNANETAY